MLVLARKKGDEIVIGDDIVISVHEISADSVKLSIDAPKEVKVLRGELVKAAMENRSAAFDGLGHGLSELEAYIMSEKSLDTEKK